MKKTGFCIISVLMCLLLATSSFATDEKTLSAVGTSSIISWVNVVYEEGTLEPQYTEPVDMEIVAKLQTSFADVLNQALDINGDLYSRLKSMGYAVDSGNLSDYFRIAGAVEFDLTASEKNDDGSNTIRFDVTGITKDSLGYIAHYDGTEWEALETYFEDGYAYADIFSASPFALILDIDTIAAIEQVYGPVTFTVDTGEVITVSSSTQTSVPQSPQTGDTAVIAIPAALMSLAALIICSKRRKQNAK